MNQDSPWNNDRPGPAGAGPPPGLVEPSARGGLRIQVVMIAIVLCAVIFWMLRFPEFELIVLGIPLAVGLFVLAVRLIANQGSIHQDALLRLLASCPELGIPLPPAVDAFAGLCRGRFRRRLLTLAELLRGGVGLPQALDALPRLLPRSEGLLIRIAWAGGEPARFPSDLTRARGRARELAWTVRNRVLYLLVLLDVLQAGVVILLYEPWLGLTGRLERIFEEFKITLPRLTRLWFENREDSTVVAVGIAVLTVELILQVVVLVTAFLGPRVELPLLGRLFRRWHARTVFRALALGMESSQPLPQILRLIAARSPSRWVRTRLRRVLERVGIGDDWIGGLRRNGFLRGSDAAVLEAAQRVGNLPWALRTLADRIEARLADRLAALSALLYPLGVVAVGVLMALFALIYFLPVIRLIEALLP